MSALRHFLRLFVILLFSVLGAGMAFAVPLMAANIAYFQTEVTHGEHALDMGFAARAPPMAMSNVAITGGVTVMQGSAFALHGQETVAALFGFDADHIAVNSWRSAISVALSYQLGNVPSISFLRNTSAGV